MKISRPAEDRLPRSESVTPQDAPCAESAKLLESELAFFHQEGCHEEFPLARAGAGALILLISACGNDETSSPATSFTATLSGANEAPPVATTATGTATLTVSGQEITYEVNVTDLLNPAGMHQWNRDRGAGHRHQWDDGWQSGE